MGEEKAALPHGQFLPWVERNAGYEYTAVKRLMNIADIPLDLLMKKGSEALFDTALTQIELAAAGREVRRGAEPQAAIKKVVETYP